MTAVMRVYPASLAGALDFRRDLSVRQRFSSRLLAGDPTLWPSPAEAASRLGWLGLPTAMRSELSELGELATEVAEEGVRDVVVLGMGGSSLAPEVFASLLGGRPDAPRLTVLDSTHPTTVAAHVDAFPPASSLYVVASKSGATIETMSFLRTFWQRAAESTGAGQKFVAITDPESPLASLAAEGDFRRLFLASPEVGGRFSALSHFGLVPAALLGIDLDALLAGARVMLEQPADAIELGLLLGEAVLAGRDKLTFLPDPALAPFLPWLEQLVAESTGKQETGLVPVFDEPAGAHFGPDRIFVRLSLGGPTDTSAAIDERLLAAGHPLVSLDWPSVGAVGGEMMRWEIATAAAGAVLNVQPFDQPDVDLAKRLARQAMAGDDVAEPDDPPIVDSSDGEALQGAMAEWLEEAAPGDYIALQAFLPPAEEVLATIAVLRESLSATGLATTLGFGPRFLHSTGQLHKGGRAGVFCLQLIDGGGPELPVPETDYGYRRLIDAQALGDARALAKRGRRVLRVRLGEQ